MNKKKLLLSFTAFFMAVAAHCARFTVDDFTYTTLDEEAHTVQLTGVSSQDAELKIPETVEYEGVTYTVTSVNLSLATFSPGTRNISIVTVSKTVEEIVRLQGSRLTSVLFAEGSQLKTIGHGAFRSNRFEEISLPESVETIGANAFQNCFMLTAIDIPNNVTTIQTYTFEGCTALTDIKLPSKLEVIENNAFYISKYESEQKRNIILPESLTSIGSQAFCYAEIHPTGSIPPTLAAGAFGQNVTVVIDYLELLAAYSNADVWKDYVTGGPTFEADGLTYRAKSDSEAELIAIPEDRKSITVPETVNCGTYQLAVTSIKDYIFADNEWLQLSDKYETEEMYIKAQLATLGMQRFPASLRHVELPQSLTRIENNTFERCGLLESISLPDNVTFIGDYAFNGCEQLRSVNFHDNLEHIGSYAFSSTAIETFVAPAKLTEISMGLFAGCSSLKTVTLHDNIVSIGELAFRGTSIENIELPANLKTLLGGCFEDCRNLKELSLPGSIETVSIDIIGGNTPITEFRIPHTVKTVYHSWNSYSAPHNLKNVFITGGTNDKYYDVDGVLFGKTEESSKPELICYPFNRDAEEYTVPDGTIGIRREAFLGAEGKETALKKVNLPEGLEHIGYNAFFNIISLESINFPKSLKDIGERAFLGDRRLIVRIPETVTNIGNNAFMVNTIYLDSTDPSSLYFDFTGTNVCVKPEAVEAYKSDRIWGRHRILSDIHETDGLIFVPNGQSEAELAGFLKTPNGTLDIPQTVTIDGVERSVTSLGAKALNFGLFTETHVPSTVRSIGSSCFLSCDSLKLVDIGDAKMDMPNFVSCSSLKRISIGENNGYHTVKDGVLYNKVMDTLQVYPHASETETFFLPESVKVIGEGGRALFNFDEQSALKSFYSLSPTMPETEITSSGNRGSLIRQTLYVPEHLVENYKKGGVWSIYEILGGIVGLSDEEIGDILADVNEIKIDGNNPTGTADDVLYTISGQRVSKPGKGLYIRNGKKVIIK